MSSREEYHHWRPTKHAKWAGERNIFQNLAGTHTSPQEQMAARAGAEREVVGWATGMDQRNP